MIDHIGMKVSDINTSKAFYEAALAPLGYKALKEFPEWNVVGFGVDASDFWISQEAHAATSAHVAFTAETHDRVDAFYDAAIKAGGKDNGKPGIREQYSPTYYAAFVLDPDGNNIEVVCHRAQ